MGEFDSLISERAAVDQLSTVDVFSEFMGRYLNPE